MCRTPGCPLPVRRNSQGHSMGYCPAHLLTHGRHTRQDGDRWLDANGYTRLKVNGRVVHEHRHVMEQSIGRALTKGENVHHINGDRADNRPENLELWVTAQPYGQRVPDLIDYLIAHHRDALEARLAETACAPL